MSVKTNYNLRREYLFVMVGQPNFRTDLVF